MRFRLPRLAYQGRMRGAPSSARFPWGGVLLLMLTSGLGASSEPPSSPARRDYVSFKVITDRNIFNAERSRRAGSADETRKPTRVETLTLVGTMSYETSAYAFFDGSSSEYKQVLEPGKTIGGFTITEINGHGIKLQAGSEFIELQVGMQLRREDASQWQVMGSRTPATTTNSLEPTGEESDLIKRLMQQREQELK